MMTFVEDVDSKNLIDKQGKVGKVDARSNKLANDWFDLNV